MGAAVDIHGTLPRARMCRELILSAEDGEAFSQAELLHAFDQCRRDLGEIVSGREGIFIGFDVLEISAALESAQILRVAAVLQEYLGGRHAVEYTATLIRGRRHVASHAERLLARASGWTLIPGRTQADQGLPPVQPVPFAFSAE